MKTLGILIISMFLIFAVSVSTVVALNIDDNAPIFSLRDSNGKFFYLSSYIGPTKNSKGVIINFFASTCAPCKKELPILNSLVDEFRKKGIDIVIIGYKEDFDKISEMLDELNVDKPVILSDVYGKVGKQYGVRGLPLTVIINRNGKVKDIIWGERPDIDKILREKTEQLLK